MNGFHGDHMSGQGIEPRGQALETGGEKNGGGGAETKTVGLFHTFPRGARGGTRAMAAIAGIPAGRERSVSPS